MTSFLPIAINLPGTDVPGGALRSDGFYAGLKFVLAPFGSESSPVPTILQNTGPDGGNGCHTQTPGSESGPGGLARGWPKQAPSVNGPAERDRHIYGRGACQCVDPDDFLVVG